MPKLVGYLIKGQFYCPDCVSAAPAMAISPIRVFKENISPYSQACSHCFGVVVEGAVGRSLFPICFSADQYFAELLKKPVTEFNQKAMFRDFLNHLIDGTVTDIKEDAEKVRDILRRLP